MEMSSARSRDVPAVSALYQPERPLCDLSTGFCVHGEPGLHGEQASGGGVCRTDVKG